MLSWNPMRSMAASPQGRTVALREVSGIVDAADEGVKMLMPLLRGKRLYKVLEVPGTRPEATLESIGRIKAPSRCYRPGRPGRSRPSAGPTLRVRRIRTSWLRFPPFTTPPRR